MVNKMNLKSILEKISEICDFWIPWNLPDRAPAAAGAPFSHIHLIAEKCSKVTSRAPILSPGVTKNAKHARKLPPETPLKNYCCNVIKNH